MTTETVHVPLGDRSYDVRIGSGLIANAADEIRPLLARPRIAVLTDETVGAAHLGALEAGLGDIETVSLALPAGEATKSWAQLERSVDRSQPVVSLAAGRVDLQLEVQVAFFEEQGALFALVGPAFELPLVQQRNSAAVGQDAESLGACRNGL